MGSPGDVGVGSLSGLLALLVSGERLGLHGLSAEEEELLASDQVPAKAPVSNYVLYRCPDEAD